MLWVHRAERRLLEVVAGVVEDEHGPVVGSHTGWKQSDGVTGTWLRHRICALRWHLYEVENSPRVEYSHWLVSVDGSEVWVGQ